MIVEKNKVVVHTINPLLSHRTTTALSLVVFTKVHRGMTGDEHGNSVNEPAICKVKGRHIFLIRGHLCS